MSHKLRQAELCEALVQCFERMLTETRTMPKDMTTDQGRGWHDHGYDHDHAHLLLVLRLMRMVTMRTLMCRPKVLQEQREH